MLNARTALTLAAPLAAALALAGCQSQPKGDDLDLGRADLMRHDYAGAGDHFDAYLKAHPAGPRTAEVYYLKGRAIEDMPSEDMNDAKAHLQQARVAYIEALKAGTDSRPLEGLIRASLADVAYWQEDYATAATQGVNAYPLIDDKAVQAWCLYRSGVSLQRLGRFEDADKTLTSVTKYHPGTEPATRAQQRIGVRSFSVRVPLETDVSSSNAVAALARQGMPATLDTAKNGVILGPYASYAQASAARTRIEAQYPKAAIVP